MKKTAFTLIEITIACALLSLVVLSAFSVSSSSNKSFETGSWRITRQKEAQRFLLRFKETMENANHAFLIEADGRAVRQGTSRDITIAGDWYGKIASTTDSAILFASSTKPARAAAPEFGRADATNGLWKGISLECYDHTLSFFQTGRWDDMLSSTPLTAGTADNSLFPIGNTEGDFITELQDVDSIGIFVELATESVNLNRPEVMLTCRVILVKPRSDGAVKIEEEIAAKISDRRESEIVSGANNYPVSRKRKL